MKDEGYTKGQTMVRMVLYILSNPWASKEQVVNKFGLSKDQYYRYLQEIQQVLPIKYSSKGPQHYVIDSITFREIFSNTDELHSLLLIIQALGETREIKKSKTLEHLRKVLGMGEEMDLLLKCCMNIERFPTDPNFREQLALVFRGIFQRRKIRFSYRHGETERENIEVEPYRIVHDQDWYLRGYAEYCKDLRTYKISRMSNIQITDDNFTMPDNVEIRVIRNPWDFDDAEPQRVVVEFEKILQQYLSEQTYHPTQQISTLPSGNLEFTVQVRYPLGMIPWILSFGTKAKVHEPDCIKQALLEEIKKTESMYS